MKRDLHAAQQNPGGFDALPMDEQGNEMMATIGEREIWLGRDHQDNNLLDDVTAAADCNSFFYTDFPPLPDFPCMSSSSSSSSTPALTKPSASSASSSSSAASWAMFKSDAEQPQQRQNKSSAGLAAGLGAALSSTASMEGGFQPSHGGIMEDVDCMDVMEDFGYLDLMDGNDIWDPSSIFHQNPDDQGEAGDYSNQEEQVSDFMLQGNSEVVQEKEETLGLDELGVMFFEWLKTNKEHISAEDMRNIKLKRATIECASKRLGSTKEGRKQLLKLILEWVEQYQLQKKRSREEAQAQEAAAAAVSQIPCQYDQEQQPFPGPNPDLVNSVPTDPNTCFSPSWIPPPPPPPSYVPDPATVMVAPPPPVVGYMGGDPYVNGTPMSCHPYPPPPTEYQMLDSAQSWPPSQYAFNSFLENGNLTPIVSQLQLQLQPQPQPQPQPHPQPLVYGDQYNSYPVFNGNGTERFARLGSSATKEARKKRMARQRRSSVHHYRHHPPNQNQHHNDTSEQQQNCTNNAQANPSNWVYWPAAAAAGSSAGLTVPMLAQPPMDGPPPRQRQLVDPASVQPQSYQQQAQSDRRQQQQQPAYKVEKNLKFLLQKVLKQSDVGNLGRIVLPKKEAETQLPELEARDGMPIAMEDIGTSKVWNMRYRFWPNNKSRMYLLENTGEFVKANGLQEGDFIVIYSDIKCGKYLIRGVKVRQPGPKAEGKKPVKRNHRNSSAAAGNGNSSKLNKH